VAIRVIGVGIAFSACEEASAVFDCVGDEVFECGEIGVGDGGADVDDGIQRAVEDGARTQGADLGCEVVDESVVCVGEGDDALDTDAVLTRGLEDAAHEDAGYALEVAAGEVVEDNGGVFTA
jgi:hypothetical protein